MTSTCRGPPAPSTTWTTTRSPRQAATGRPGVLPIRSRSVDHVGIYVGNDRFVHARRGKKVRVSDLNSSYWKRHYLAGKRILPTTLAQVESTRKR